jgi:hypothetical protein
MWCARRQTTRSIRCSSFPDEQAPPFHVPGPHGGWFVSLLYGFGTSVDVPMRERERGDPMRVHARIVTKGLAAEPAAMTLPLGIALTIDDAASTGRLEIYDRGYPRRTRW